MISAAIAEKPDFYKMGATASLAHRMLHAQVSAQNISLRILCHHKQGVIAMSTSGKITALVAGSAVIGAGLGLLLAPQTGSETRKQVRQYAKRTQHQAVRLSRSVQAGFTRAIEHGKSLQDMPGRRPVEAA